MSSSDIRAGDLVYVAKPTPCCNSPYGLGTVFEVEEIAAFDGNCGECGAEGHREPVALGANGWWLLYCLKKFDPESAPADTRKEATA